MTSKKELRQAFRDLIRDGQASAGVDSSVAAPSSAALNEQLVRLLTRFEGSGPSCWASFQPTGFEPDIRQAMEKLAHIDWVFPRVEGESLRFYHPGRPAVFSLSRWGILEPDPSRARLVSPERIHGFLIPGVAFDLQCNRLGRGKGFYDRALSEIEKTNKSAIKIGVALDRQISEREIPVEAFDVPMDWVATESRLLRRGDTNLPQRKTS